MIINVLLENDYPIDFIFKIINARLKSLFLKRTLKQNNDICTTSNKNENKTSWFTIPYIPNTSDKFRNITKDGWM